MATTGTLEREHSERTYTIGYMGDVHYHLWVRSGRVFTMRTKRYETRIAAQKAGERAGLLADARMVRQCADCPASVRSKRRRPSRTQQVRRLAAALGVQESDVLAAFEAAGM